MARHSSAESNARLVAESLNPVERKILEIINIPVIGISAEDMTDSDNDMIGKNMQGMDFSSIVAKLGLQDVEVMRGIQWLQNKELVSIQENISEIADLDINGIKYLDEGLPERQLLQLLVENREMELSALKQDLSPEEIGVSIGILKKKSAIEVDSDGKNTVLRITENGSKYAEKEFLEEKFLKKNFPIDTSAFLPEEKFSLAELARRKRILKVGLKKNRLCRLTSLGESVKSELKKVGELIEKLSPDVFRSGDWKYKSFRRYDIKSKVPAISGGRKQHYKWFLDHVRETFLSLGFCEMSGPIVESAFWDMDALFMPQFHSARDIHGGYYIKDPTHLSRASKDIPEKILEKVKEAHEKGVAGSRGWRYKFDVNETRKLLLRTQTTACSARMLANPELKIPGKYFAIANNFRPDVVDAKHSCDFLQVEGIVIEQGLNLRHLFGLLEMFAKEVAGAEEVKITPGYFPFTEPSCELFIKHPKLGWMELGGAGMFRPELVQPLVGKYVPVIAWGLGIPRIAMQKYKINDIRELNSYDLGYLRNFSIKELV